MERRRTALSVRALFLLSLLTAPVVFGPRPARADVSPLRFTGSGFVDPVGQAVFLIGANYAGPTDRAWVYWEDGQFDPNLVAADFDRLAGAGVRAVRIFVRSALARDIRAGRWSKLDTVVNLAASRNLHLLITFNDYREDDLVREAALNQAIAARYRGNPAILGYDLKNEPHFQDLAVAIYPGGPPPLQTDALIRVYGERVARADIPRWRQDEGRGLVPDRFDDAQAYYYANNYRLFREFAAEAATWVAARDYAVSVADYIASPEAAKWQPLIQALDQTLAAWLNARLGPVKQADPDRPVTVGYSDLILASLPANRALDFISWHRFPQATAANFSRMFQALDTLSRLFPDRPVILEEFGFATDQLDPAEAALFESAVLLRSFAQGRPGAFKWQANDLAVGANPTENTYGLFSPDGTPKPSALAFRAASEFIRAVRPTGFQWFDTPQGPAFRLVGESGWALGRALNLPEAGIAAESPVSAAQLFIWRPAPDRLEVRANAPTRLTLNLAGGKLIPAWQPGWTVLAAGPAGPNRINPAGGVVQLDLEAGKAYSLRVQSPNAAAGMVDAKIELVFPHDQAGRPQPVDKAPLVNVLVYLFEADSLQPVACNLPVEVRLRRASNLVDGAGNAVNVPARYQSPPGQPVLRRSGDKAFPAWVFNDVPVSFFESPGLDPARSKDFFLVEVKGAPYRSNVWAHGADARTYLPAQSPVAAGAFGQAEPSIQVVWPHAGGRPAPVEQATHVNIGVDLVDPQTRASAPASFPNRVVLLRGLNTGILEPVKAADGVVQVQDAGGAHPRWVFNNVPVGAARDPVNKYYFVATIEGAGAPAAVWAHGADARTYLPQPDIPYGSGQGCE